MDGGAGDAKDREVGASQLQARLSNKRFTLSVLFVGRAFTEEEDTGGFGAGGRDGFTVIGTEGATIHILKKNLPTVAGSIRESRHGRSVGMWKIAWGSPP